LDEIETFAHGARIGTERVGCRIDCGGQRGHGRWLVGELSAGDRGDRSHEVRRRGKTRPMTVSPPASDVLSW
jgi:hypothetical protein